MKIVLTSDTHNLEGGWFWRMVADEKPDLVVHAGDWTMEAKELEEAMARMRTWYKGPAVTVAGNHDMWGKIMLLDFTMIANRHDISVAEGDVFDINGITIAGFMGWYQEAWPFPMMNDCRWINRDTWEALQNMQKQSITRIMEDGRERIELLFAHFPLQTAAAKLLSRKVKRVLIGHWHQPVDAEWFGMRIINTGSNYHQPKHLVLEL